MRVVSLDSKVLTVINRQRGVKGYRLLQGDNLRSLFLELIWMQVAKLEQRVTHSAEADSANNECYNSEQTLIETKKDEKK